MSPAAEPWLLPFGFAVAALGTMVGVGGGIILVPVLLLAFPEIPADVITELSLMVVAATALAGTAGYARIPGRIDYRSGIRYALATIPGAIGGVWVVQHVNMKQFSIAFAVLLLVVGVMLLSRITHPLWSDVGNLPRTSGKGLTAAAVVGFLATVFGIGGGALLVPVLVGWLGYPVLVATATSSFVLAITATLAVIIHGLTHGFPPYVDTAFFLAAGAVPGALVGARMSSRVNTRVLMLALVAVMLALAGKLGWRALLF